MKQQYPIQFSTFYPNMATSIAAPLYVPVTFVKLNMGNYDRCADEHVKLYVDTTVNTTT